MNLSLISQHQNVAFVVLCFQLTVTESFKARDDEAIKPSNLLTLHISEFLHISVRCDIVYVIYCICVFPEVTERNSRILAPEIVLVVYHTVFLFVNCLRCYKQNIYKPQASNISEFMEKATSRTLCTTL